MYFYPYGYAQCTFILLGMLNVPLSFWACSMYIYPSGHVQCTFILLVPLNVPLSFWACSMYLYSSGHAHLSEILLSLHHNGFYNVYRLQMLPPWDIIRIRSILFMACGIVIVWPVTLFYIENITKVLPFH